MQRARVREARRERDRAVRVPAAPRARAGAGRVRGLRGLAARAPARDFSLFRPPLERIVSLSREEADAVGYDGGERYDALLDQYEPDMRVARLEPLLHGLRDELVPFVQEIAARPRPDDAFVHRARIPTQAQRARRCAAGRATSASTSRPGAWTRRRTRSPRASRPATSA